jgi:uroporphyrinogen-III synthase
MRMSELREKRWSVVSERGCEASSVNYEEAAKLVARLRADKIHGLCIISDEAARRYASNNNHSKPNATEAKPAATPPTAKKRAPRRKSAKLS